MLLFLFLLCPLCQYANLFIVELKLSKNICVSFDLNIQICFEVLILFHFNLSVDITCTDYFRDMKQNQ